MSGNAILRSMSGRRGHSHESDVRVPPSTSDVGDFGDKLRQKRGSFSEAHKKRGSFSEMHQKIGAFRTKMAKNFSTFRQFCRNFRKIQFFAENCHLFDY